MNERLVVGIDLGTTHTVVASADPAPGKERTPVVFAVPQLVSEKEIEARPLYASSLYLPLDAERGAFADVLGDAPWITGELAKRRGTEVPGRVVSSAKSWLCHPGVDRLAAILPWGSGSSVASLAGEPDADVEPDIARISPLDASARLLAHVRRAWDAAHPDHPLFDQDVVLTVPASFDETARELTVRAAELAGLEVRLLEEPLAAFYDFLSRVPAAELLALAQNAGGAAHVLVVDVGGGTTDLSLLVVRADDRTAEGVTVERIAVGRHLLLGGDNMDLAIAHLCESRLVEAGARLPPGRFAQLTNTSRAAKERLLASTPPASIPVVVAGAGSRLVGSTLRTELTAEEVERVVLDGFFPFVEKTERPSRAKSALVAFGLPYERDVAITRHVAEFVARHVPEGSRVDALLLNGGVFNAARARERIAAVLGAWSAPAAAPTVLSHTDPDLAVARGAVLHGLAVRGLSLRISAGAPRAYYVGLATGDPKQRRAMCVVPRGAAEETVMVADRPGLALVVGKPVRFDLYVSDDAPKEAPGDVVDLDAPPSGTDFERLPPLAVHFPREAASRTRDEVVQIGLEGKLTAVGTLELACVERGAASARRFQLAFQLREAESVAPGEAVTSSPPSVLPKLPGGAAPRSLAPRAPSHMPSPAGAAGTKREEEAREALDRAFGKARADNTGREAKDLVRELERILGDRGAWNMELARSLFDAIAPLASGRRRSADHERTFWMLAGFLLRPGFGAPNDAARVAAIAPLFEHRLAFPDELRSWTQFFIAWRRIAAGLSEEDHVRIRDFVDPFLAPPEAGLKKSKKAKKELEGDFDMLELAGSLERAGSARRSQLGAWVIERTYTERDPRLWAVLGRLGARVPAYASAHHVVAPLAVERWLDHLMREKWETIPTAAQAAAGMARLTGDRARDVSERVRSDVARRLEALATLPGQKTALLEGWARAVREVVSFSDEDRTAFFGEDLPAGLRLVQT